MSSGWVLTLTPAAARTGAEKLGLGPDGFMELTGEILSVCDVGTRVGSMRDSERDRLPEWFFVLQDLPSTGVVIPEVHVPMTLEVALACAERGVEVDAWLATPDRRPETGSNGSREADAPESHALPEQGA